MGDWSMYRNQWWNDLKNKSSLEQERQGLNLDYYLKNVLKLCLYYTFTLGVISILG